MSKKVALCFLTYNNLSQPKLWESFISPKYNIYIHNKNKISGIFQQYCLVNKVKTKPNDISLIRATLNLFKEAYKKEDNEYFVLLSGNCVPLYVPDVLHTKITEIDNNMLNIFKLARGTDFYDNKYESIKKKHIFDKINLHGQQQWIILKRNTVKMFIENDYTDLFGEYCNIPHEIFFVNIMIKYRIPFVTKTVVYENRNKNDSFIKGKKKLCMTHQHSSIKTYTVLTNQNIENILKSDALFMRKVSDKCILPSYFHKIRPLKFIHITKTAGTSIEIIGKENNICWGMFHTEYGPWHTPFTSKPESIKDGYSWFTVVRNPYTRIISEFYCKWGTKIDDDKKKSMSVEEFNETIKTYILHRDTIYDNECDRCGGGHYKEQHLYIDKKYDIHILKFENIELDFNNLMEKYSLNIKLNIKKNVSDKIYTVDSLSPEVIELINTVYDEDFKLFGYKKITKNN